MKDRYMYGYGFLICGTWYSMSNAAQCREETLLRLQREGFTRKEAEEYLQILIDEEKATRKSRR